MRGIVRLLVMFGPMIFRQFQKFQRNKQRQQPQLPQRDNRPRSNRDPRHQQNEHVQYKDLNKELGTNGRGRAMSAEERDFHLKEDEIMLSDEELKGLRANAEQVNKLDKKSLKNIAKDKIKGVEDSDYDEFFEG